MNTERTESSHPDLPLPGKRPAGCSLASILLLGLVFAVLMAGVRMTLAAPTTLHWEITLCMGVLGATVGVLIGVSVGWSRGQGCATVLLGLLGGAVFGGLTGVLVATPRNILVVAVGSGILVVFAAWVRWHAPPEP
jgi:hypothetical protein